MIKTDPCSTGGAGSAPEYRGCIATLPIAGTAKCRGTNIIRREQIDASIAH